jgi:hypothetical protein
MISFAALMYMTGQVLALGFMVRKLWRAEMLTPSEYVLMVACVLLIAGPIIGPVFE